MIIKDANVTELREAMVKIAGTVGLGEGARVELVVARATEDMGDYSLMLATIRDVLDLLRLSSALRGVAAKEAVAQLLRKIDTAHKALTERAERAEGAVLGFWQAKVEHAAATKAVAAATATETAAFDKLHIARGKLDELGSWLDDQDIPF